MIRGFPAVALGLLLAGAALPQACAPSAPTRFYVLAAIPAPEAKPRAVEARPVIGLGPVTLPEYLDRPQIVTRRGGSRLELAALDHWAEPLNEALPRVLAEDLGSRLAAHRVVPFPWGVRQIAYQVVVDVRRFENRADGEAVLVAEFAIYRGDRQQELLLERRRRFDESASREASATSGYESRVAALSRLLAQLSGEIADSLASVGAS